MDDKFLEQVTKVLENLKGIDPRVLVAAGIVTIAVASINAMVDTLSKD